MTKQILKTGLIFIIGCSVIILAETYKRVSPDPQYTNVGNISCLPDTYVTPASNVNLSIIGPDVDEDTGYIEQSMQDIPHPIDANIVYHWSAASGSPENGTGRSFSWAAPHPAPIWLDAPLKTRRFIMGKTGATQMILMLPEVLVLQSSR